MAEKILYSSHIFMFPFRFDWNKRGFDYEFEFYKHTTIDDRVDFKLDVIKERLKDSWIYEEFDLKRDLNKQKDYMYNEFAYFYDYARDVIYNLSKEQPISYYFEHKNIQKGDRFEIYIKSNDKPYILEIQSVSLRFFDSGVGILSIELENYETGKFEDILNINDFGRRVYPQFIANCQTYAPKGSFLADKIVISGENFDVCENFNFLPSDDIRIGSHILKLLGASFSDDKSENNSYYIQPSLDDRMFVLSWYGNKALSSKLVDENYITDDDWYKYVYVDGKDKTIFSSTMQTNLIKDVTYDRWMNYKYQNKCSLTLYGISRYSFVCLSTSAFPKVHLHSMYFQMVTLLLATRASILRFSDEVSATASDSTLNIKNLSKLYKRYLTFYNRLYFKEVTHQEQGIELYDIALEQMKIPEHIEKLDGKFTKLFDFADLQSEKKTTKAMNDLTKMGSMLIFPSLVISILQLDSVKDKLKTHHYDDIPTLVCIIIVSVIVGYFISYAITKEER